MFCWSVLSVTQPVDIFQNVSWVCSLAMIIYLTNLCLWVYSISVGLRVCFPVSRFWDGSHPSAAWLSRYPSLPWLEVGRPGCPGDPRREEPGCCGSCVSGFNWAQHCPGLRWEIYQERMVRSQAEVWMMCSTKGIDTHCVQCAIHWVLPCQVTWVFGLKLLWNGIVTLLETYQINKACLAFVC